MDTLTAEPPAMRSGRITPDIARERALAMHAKRREREAKAEQDAKDAAALREKLAQFTPQSGRLAAQLREIEDMMQGADPDTLLKLSGAHARLFSAWQVLTGTPNPGARKAGRNQKPPAIQPEPIPVIEPQKPCI